MAGWAAASAQDHGPPLAPPAPSSLWDWVLALTACVLSPRCSAPLPVGGCCQGCRPFIRQLLSPVPLEQTPRLQTKTCRLFSPTGHSVLALCPPQPRPPAQRDRQLGEAPRMRVQCVAWLGTQPRAWPCEPIAPSMDTASRAKGFTARRRHSRASWRGHLAWARSGQGVLGQIQSRIVQGAGRRRALGADRKKETA